MGIDVARSLVASRDADDACGAWARRAAACAGAMRPGASWSE